MTASPTGATLCTDLTEALSRGALTVHLQPKVRVCDGQILGAEALVRGRRGRGDLAALQRLGCDSAQGYRMSPPMPGEKFLPWPNTWRAPAQLTVAAARRRASLVGAVAVSVVGSSVGPGSSVDDLRRTR